jgi:ELWxxDGT repeat protein
MLRLREHSRLGGPVVLTALIALAAPSATAAVSSPAVPYLVADLNRQPSGSGSNPWFQDTLNGRLFFSADDGIHDRQFWATDGTPGGTVRLSDDEYDPFYTYFLLRIVGDHAFFSLRDDLWVSDGTVAGTQLLPTRFNARSGAGVLGDRLYFLGATGLWSSAGTAAGTGPVGAGGVSDSGDSLYPGPPAFGPAVGGRLFFRGDDDHSLWVTDGTVAGTARIADAAWPQSMVAAGGRLLFRAGVDAEELWVSDGTAEGTRSWTEPGVDWSFLGVVGARFLYAGLKAGGWELRAGTGRPSEATVLAVASEPPGALFAPLDGAALIALSDAAHGRELWRTDGTPGGTRLVRDIAPGTGGSDPGSALMVDGRMLFTATEPTHGFELWSTDGTTAGTTLVRDILPGPLGSTPVLHTVVAGRAMLVADDGLHGAEPWVSDGTAAGTHLLADVAPGPQGSMNNIRTFAQVGGAVLFAADDGTVGRELWGISLAGETGTCVADAGTLCFQDGRFAARVEWTDQRSGDSGVGGALPGVGRTGSFWFFRPDNTELVVKLLDGRRINGYFWFFYGALTDVEYDLVVTDTLADRTRTYHNPPGWSCGGGDTTAFPGAP